jgi:F0F1-type ATP synthase epsilon subunit
MMARDLLHVIIRTPRETVLETECHSIRVPTQTGQVGLRPRSEASVLAVEAGLILLSQPQGTRYAGTAGGLLRNHGNEVSLLTPLAVSGDDVESVSRQLDQLLSVPSEEMEVRQALGRLETRILQEVQQGDGEASRVSDLGKK